MEAEKEKHGDRKIESMFWVRRIKGALKEILQYVRKSPNQSKQKPLKQAAEVRKFCTDLPEKTPHFSIRGIHNRVGTDKKN